MIEAQEGDTVALIISKTWSPKRVEFVKVEKATKTHVTVTGVKFNRSHGWTVGDRYSDRFIEYPVTEQHKIDRQEYLEYHYRNALTDKLDDVRWKNYSTETMEAVCDLLKIQKPEKATSH